MTCPTVTTGGEFLVRTLAHLDCQAQTLGSFGFEALAAPGSPASLALTGLLTLFIAIFAIRMLMGTETRARDAVNGILKIGIVLTLAVSWPAFRVLAYDTVLLAPAEVASAMTPSSLPDTGSGFAARLQNIDTGIASLTQAGTGRQTGSLELEERQDGAFRAIGLVDESALGWGRTIWLGSVIGSLAILRISGGLLLALAPLVAGLLLFDFTRGLFAGWFRGLVLVALGSLGLTLLLAVEVAVMEPWLADALNRRSLGYATPAAPTELLALALAFAIAAAGLFFLLAKIAFQNAWWVPFADRARDRPAGQTPQAVPAAAGRPIELTAHARALSVSEGVMNLVRHEEGRRSAPRQLALLQGAPQASTGSPARGAMATPIGSSWRRTSQRTTAAQTNRDNRR
jgi:type IV secretion system protein VirB6